MDINRLKEIIREEIYNTLTEVNDSYARVSKPKFIKDKNNPNFLYVNFKYDTGGGVLTALGKETMAGQIRRLSSAEAMKQATALAKDLEAKYNLEDIDVYDKENGVVQIFAVSDDFIDIDPNMLGKSVNEVKTYKKGDKLKIKLKNGKKFDVIFDVYANQKGVAFGKFKDGSGEYDTKPFSLDSIVVNEATEEDLNEMAKITGNLKSSIEKVIQDNPDLEGLPLKKKIKADKSVENALEGDTLYDNQLNKFIALIKGEREVGKRGRKANPTKIPTTKSLKKPTPDKQVSKPIKTTGMDNEDKEAFKSGESDEIAKSISKSTPEEKKEKFNLGLKFIKKYKDDKPKIDAYLKKAKEEYKLSTSMLKDLKRAAGRDVKS